MSRPSSPRATVVVASNRDVDLLLACVDSLGPQCAEAGAELIVVRAGSLPAAESERLVARGAKLIVAPPTATIPELRGLGMQESAGGVVVITEDHCVAAADWLSLLLAAATGDVTGGAMDNARRDRMVDWGAYFSEYGFFASGRQDPGGEMPPLITGANVAYGPAVAEEVAAWARAGDWENVAHQRLAARGHTFRFEPRAVILQNRSYELAAFCVDRFEHGLDYARTRLALEGTAGRWTRFVATPVLPFLLAWRVGVAAARGRVMTFLRALPATLIFLGAWSLGEAAGYLAGPAPQESQ